MVAPASDFVDSAKRLASEQGFELAGVVPLSDENGTFPELDHFPEWLALGRAGEMEYLKARDEAGRLKRAALRNVAPWAKSIVVCAINYNSDLPYSTEMRDASRGWISRYAWFGGEKPVDYHDAVLARLRRVEVALHEQWHSEAVPLRTRSYVDTGPLVERVYAKYAGIGWIAKNTCVINEKFGSWLFLGSILTSMELKDATEAAIPLPADRCGSCTRCIEACPTGALIAPYKMDASKCISYLTIEKRGSIAEGLSGQMGNNVFGCDICQDVCPWNGASLPAESGREPQRRKMPLTRAAEFTPREDLVAPSLERLGAMSREEFNQTFRGTPIKRAKYAGMRRNVAIAMGNSGDPRFIPRLQEMAADADSTVAEHARRALQKLTPDQTT